MASASRTARLSRVARAARTVALTALLGLTGALALPAPGQATPGCTLASDPGCFFAETFESGNLNGWAPHGNITVVSPGLLGSGFKARFYNAGLSPSSGMDSSISYSIPNGSVYYLDFWLEYEAGFMWRYNSTAGNSSFKTIDVIGPNAPGTCPGGGGNRMLLTVWGSSGDSPAYTRGHPQISAYPNYCLGGTDVNAQSNKATEKFATVVPDFAFEGGHAPYHVVIEVTSATGPNGGYRMWVDDVLITQLSGLQTSTDATFRPNAIGLGGPQANAGPGQAHSYDQIRFSMTAGATAPTTPPVAPPTADTSAPKVAVTAPTPAAAVAGQTQIKVTATDNVGVTALKYYVDGALIAVVAPPTPSFAWNTTSVADGAHTLAVTAVDAAGNTAQTTVAVTVANRAPTALAIAAPAITYGANGLVTVSVSAATVPTGTVALVVDGGAAQTAALVSGKAQFTLTVPGPGVHTLAASYAAQGAFTGSSAAGSLSVGASSGPIAFTGSAFNAVSLSYKMAITLVRSGASGPAVTVNFATADGSARSGVDYIATSGTASFAAGATQQTVYVQMVGGPMSAPKTLTMTLSAAGGGAQVGSPSLTTVTIGAPSSVAGLVAAYGLNQGSGASDTDVSGHGNTLKIQGAKWIAQGRYGSALSFDGATNYATVPSLPSLANWTVSAWVQSPAAPAAGPAAGVIHKESNLQIDWNHPEPMYRGAAAVKVNGTWYAASFGPLTANTWYALTATFDGRTLSAYANGILVTATPVAQGPAATDANPLTIGKHAVNPQFFKGTIDEVRIYSRALSVSEIQQNLNLAL